MVPDFTKNATAQEHTQDWVDEMLAPHRTQAQIFRFEYRIDMTGYSIWRQLSQKGEDLLNIFRRKGGIFQVFFGWKADKLYFVLIFLEDAGKTADINWVWFGWSYH